MGPRQNTLFFTVNRPRNKENKKNRMPMMKNLLLTKKKTSPQGSSKSDQNCQSLLFGGFQGCWGGWLGWLNVPAAIRYAKILLVTLNCTSPPSFIQIGPKFPKLVVRGGFWVGGVGGWGGINMGLTTHVLLFRCVSPKIYKLAHQTGFGGGRVVRF